MAVIQVEEEAVMAEIAAEEAVAPAQITLQRLLLIQQ